ncbi:MAG: hypothetical protein ISS34_03255 [Candidatus Omnitrophica bacterium]|nr:hypothetical protein [Candidatus Omnitrophota bacterium]
MILYFKNGSNISGKLVRKTDDYYVIRWKGGEVTFYSNEIDYIEEGATTPDRLGQVHEEEIWPYENDIAIKLTNGTVIDAEIIDVKKEIVTTGRKVGEGRIEQDIEREKIEYLLFKPVSNNETKKKERDFKKLFPEMRFYKDGNVTVITDSYVTWVNKYKATLRSVYTEIYFEFFTLYKERKPEFQNFVVIFDGHIDFIEYAIADGVPGWAVLGYYNPDERVLYLFNSLGDKFSEFIFEVLIGEKARAVDEIVDRLKKATDNKYELLLEGQAADIKDKFWRYYNMIKADLKEETFNTLRHEFTHELFNNWGLQSIIVSRAAGKRSELIEKKREYLETEDLSKKREMLRDLVTMSRERYLAIDLEAANSWLAEGTATFCETYPLGDRNRRWLFLFQKMKREGIFYPLEHLTVYKMGSFPGVCPEAMLYAYAQSWALVYFLMDRYPDRFMEYQDRLTRETPKEDEDIRWFLEALGKDLRTLEGEFLEYMAQFDELEDPFIKKFVKWNNIFNEFK